MALETNQTASSATAGLLDSWIVRGRRWLSQAAHGKPATDAEDESEQSETPSLISRALTRASQTPLGLFLSRSLLRRIMAANVLGLIILVGGINYFSQYHSWLIDAKRDALKIQGEMIAAAIASDARVEKGALQFNPAQSGPDAAKTEAFDDPFAKLEMSIKPEKVSPILRRLSTPTKTRARIYDLNGTLVVDTESLMMRGQLNRSEAANANTGRQKTKNFWTRLKAWVIDQELPVYKEIGSGNGLSYPEVRSALNGTTTSMLLLTDKGDQMVSVALPVKRADTTQGVLLLSTRPGEIDDILEEERSLILTIGSVALLATILSSLLLARTVAGPMRRLSEAADHVSQSITARRELPTFEGRDDEVGQMATAFRAMTTSLYRRINASDRFAADVAHELKNPVAAARSTAESLSYARDDEHRAQLVRQIQRELKRLNRLITDVASASRLDADLARQQNRKVDVTTVIANVASIFKEGADNNCSVKAEIAPTLLDDAYSVQGDEGRLSQVLTNLTDNALSFSPEGGVVKIKLHNTGSHVVLVVEDQGPGIPDDRLDKIFDRFYTDRPGTENKRGKNSGLGLSISREIVTAHKGTLIAQNIREPGRDQTLGARFVVMLPAISGTTRQSAPRRA
jgi:two-component system, OmpR family, sensor histidine kinase ChvG